MAESYPEAGSQPLAWRTDNSAFTVGIALGKHNRLAIETHTAVQLFGELGHVLMGLQVNIDALRPPDEPYPRVGYQAQPTGTTCVHACVAMALGVPVYDVIEAWGDDPKGALDLIVFLKKCRVRFNQLVLPAFQFTGWHFVTVPSLNNPGGGHCILVHYNDDTSKLTIRDPSMGKIYGNSAGDHPLCSWSNLVPFVPGGKLPTN